MNHKQIYIMATKKDLEEFYKVLHSYSLDYAAAQLTLDLKKNKKAMEDAKRNQENIVLIVEGFIRRNLTLKEIETELNEGRLDQQHLAPGYENADMEKMLAKLRDRIDNMEE